MKLHVIITGATGMVGKGVLLECLESPYVESVLVINRRPLDILHDKLKEIIVKDFLELSEIENQLKGYNACFYCLGISAFRMSESDYSKITYDMTMNLGETLLRINPGIGFCYVSGQGTDSTEKGRMMWARVKGKTENALLSLPFKSAYMFRPGYIQPMKGIRSSTKMYNMMYALMKPLYPILNKIFADHITNTTRVGKAMINAMFLGYDKKHLDNSDINLLASK